MSSVDIDKMRRTPPPGFSAEYITAPPLQDGPWRAQSLVLDISGRCNMACGYCAESITMPKRHPMSPEILDKTWKFLFPNGVTAIKEGKEGEYYKDKMFSFHIGTGEPFLNLPMLKKVRQMVDRAHAEGNDNPRVFLTTNAYLLDKELMDWLLESGWQVKISLDGPAAVHDKWRVLAGGGGTYDRAAQAAAYMAEKKPEQVAVCAVICRGADPAEVFDVIEKLGVRMVDMSPVAHRDEAIIPGPEDFEKYREFVKNYAARFLRDDLSEDNPPPVFTNFSQCMMRLMGYNLARATCGASRHYYAVGPGGDIYPCGRFIGVGEYRLGHIDTGLEQQPLHDFRNGAGRAYDGRQACGHCWAAPLCCGPCYACAEMFGPGNGEPIDYQCAYVLATAEAAVSLFNRLKGDNPERLLLFMPQYGGFLDFD